MSSESISVVFINPASERIMELESGQGELMLQESRSPRRKPTKKRANDLDGATWLRNSISVWGDIRKTPEEAALKHPAMFPAQLVKRLIESFTREGQQLILDPFAGIGSTVIAAEALGKTGIGFDISPEFIAKARARPNQSGDLFTNGAVNSPGERRLYVEDANNLLHYVEQGTVDLVVTSPPYWDILLQQRTADNKAIRNYGDSDTDLGRIPEYESFLDALADVFSRVFQALKPGGYCCVIVMDLRKGPVFYPFHSDLAARMTTLGFIYDDLIIWDRSHEYNNLRPLGHPSVFRINKVHEFILIFQRPNDARG